MQGGGGRHNGPRCGRASQSVKRGVRPSRHACAHSAAIINGFGTNAHVAGPAPSELAIALGEARFSKWSRSSRMRNPRLKKMAKLLLLHRRMTGGTALRRGISAPPPSFCLSHPARPTPSGIVACRLRSMRAMLPPRQLIRPPSKAGPTQGARAPEVTIRGAPTEHRIPDICTENPRSALPLLASG